LGADSPSVATAESNKVEEYANSALFDASAVQISQVSNQGMLRIVGPSLFAAQRRSASH